MITNRKLLSLLGAAALTVALTGCAQAAAADPAGTPAASAPWFVPSHIVAGDKNPRTDRPWPSPDDQDYECHHRRC
jgi:hypothetical protein